MFKSVDMEICYTWITKADPAAQPKGVQGNKVAKNVKTGYQPIGISVIYYYEYENRITVEMCSVTTVKTGVILCIDYDTVKLILVFEICLYFSITTVPMFKAMEYMAIICKTMKGKHISGMIVSTVLTTSFQLLFLLMALYKQVAYRKLKKVQNRPITVIGKIDIMNIL